MTSLVIFVILAAVLVGGLLYRGERTREREQARQTIWNATVDRVRSGFGPHVFAVMRENARTAVLPRAQRQTRFTQRVVHWEGRKAEWSKHVWKGKAVSPGFVGIVCALSTVWLFLLVLQRAMDIQIIAALGYRPGMAPVLGTVVALAFVVFGLLVTGLLGLHDLLPSAVELRRSIRIGLAVLFLGVAVILMARLQQVAVYRAISTVGQQVSKDQKLLAQVQASTPIDQVELAAVRQQLIDDLARLDTAKNLDRALIVLVPPVEMLLSAAPVLGVELLAIGAAGIAGRCAARGERREGNKIARIGQQVQQEATRVADAADVHPAQVRQWANELDGPMPAETPAAPLSLSGTENAPTEVALPTDVRLGADSGASLDPTQPAHEPRPDLLLDAGDHADPATPPVAPSGAPGSSNSGSAGHDPWAVV